MQAAESKCYSAAPPVLTSRSGNTDFEEIVSEIFGSETEAIVSFGHSEEWKALFSLLNLYNMDMPVFSTTMDLDEGLISRSSIPVFAIVPERWNSEESKDFRAVFNKKYGYETGIYASYVYDGAVALLETIKLSGENRTKIQEGLLEIDFIGINGPVSFDSSGMIKGTPKITQINSSLSAQ